MTLYVPPESTLTRLLDFVQAVRLNARNAMKREPRSRAKLALRIICTEMMLACMRLNALLET